MQRVVKQHSLVELVLANLLFTRNPVELDVGITLVRANSATCEGRLLDPSWPNVSKSPCFVIGNTPVCDDGGPWRMAVLSEDDLMKDAF